MRPGAGSQGVSRAKTWPGCCACFRRRQHQISTRRCSPTSCAKPGRRVARTGRKSRTQSTRAICQQGFSHGSKNSLARLKPNGRTCTRGFTAPMLVDYLQGTVPQLIERARLMKGKIPRGLPRDYEALIKTCHDELDNIIGRLRELLTLPPNPSLAVRH